MRHAMESRVRWQPESGKIDKNRLTIYSYLVHMFLFCSLCRIGMQWTGNGLGLGHQTQQRSTQRDSRGPFRHAGQCHGFAASALCLLRRVARPPSRRIRRASPYCHCGTGPCGEGGAFASHAQGARSGKGTGAGFPPSSSSIRGKISPSCASPGSNTPSIRRASFSSGLVPGWTPCGRCPSPLLLPPGRPMAWSMPNESPAGSRPSSWRLRTCRARPGAWPAGG